MTARARLLPMCAFAFALGTYAAFGPLPAQAEEWDEYGYEDEYYGDEYSEEYSEEDYSEDESVAAEAETEAEPEAEAEPAPEDPGIYLNYDWNFDAVSTEEVSPGVFEQSTPAMLPYTNDTFVAVENEYFGLQTSKDYVHVGNYDPDPHFINYLDGNMFLEFRTLVQLPVTLEYSADLGNPQAMCMTPDGTVAYVAYPDGYGHSASQTGRIIKYDLAKLREYGAMEGDLSAFASGVRLGDEAWLSCMTVGPRINMGHGQTMDIDPSTGRLWLSAAASAEYSDLTLIDTETLDAVGQIRFHTGTTDFGSVLTFDECGNFYYVKRSSATWDRSPAGSLRIYQGRISDNCDKVLIRLLTQSVLNPAGTTLQGVAWNPVTDTLFVVNDAALLAVDMRPLIAGQLTLDNVHTEFLTPLREFESMEFDAEGRGYLIVNRHSEILQTIDPGV